MFYKRCILDADTGICCQTLRKKICFTDTKQSVMMPASESIFTVNMLACRKRVWSIDINRQHPLNVSYSILHFSSSLFLSFCLCFSENSLLQGAVSVCICLKQREREQRKYHTARHHARRNRPSLQSAEMLGLKSKCVRSNQKTAYIRGGNKSCLTLNSLTPRVWFKAPFSHDQQKTC